MNRLFELMAVVQKHNISVNELCSFAMLLEMLEERRPAPEKSASVKEATKPKRRYIRRNGKSSLERVRSVLVSGAYTAKEASKLADVNPTLFHANVHRLGKAVEKKKTADGLTTYSLVPSKLVNGVQGATA